MTANFTMHESPREIVDGAKLPRALPAGSLHLDSREAFDLLESLDDAMFAAIAGEAAALESAREHWRRALGALSAELIDESREHYLRFAVDVARRFECDRIRDPAKVMVAVEVIELLTKG